MVKIINQIQFEDNIQSNETSLTKQIKKEKSDIKYKVVKTMKKQNLIVSLPTYEEQATECSHECHQSSK